MRAVAPAWAPCPPGRPESRKGAYPYKGAYYIIAPAGVPPKFVAEAYIAMRAYIDYVVDPDAMWTAVVSSYFHVINDEAAAKAFIGSLEKWPDEDVVKAAKSLAGIDPDLKSEEIHPKGIHIVGPAYAYVLLAKAWGVELKREVVSSKGDKVVSHLCVGKACIEEDALYDGGRPYYIYYDFAEKEEELVVEDGEDELQGKHLVFADHHVLVRDEL